MGRPPCCDKTNVKKGPWTAEEDAKILAYVANHGIGNWTLVPQKAGLNRCGKSCRLRWTNYLRPDLKHDTFTPQEEDHILKLHKAVGSRWSLIAKQLPGRTDNDVKNHWNTKLSKKLSKMGIDPITHKPFSQIFTDFGNISGLPNTRNQIPPFQNFLNTPPSILKKEPLQVPTQFLNTPTLNNPILNQPWENLGQFQIPHPPNSFNESSPSSSSYSCYQTPHVQMVPPPPSSSSSSTSSSSVWTDFLLLEDPRREVENGTGQCDFGSEINGSNFINGSEILKKSSEANSSSSSSTVVEYSFVEAILNKDSEMQLEFPLPLDVYYDY